MMAAKNRSGKAISALLELKTDVDIISPRGESALSCSLISQNTEIMDKICQDTNTFDAFMKSAGYSN